MNDQDNTRFVDLLEGPLSERTSEDWQSIAIAAIDSYSAQFGIRLEGGAKWFGEGVTPSIHMRVQSLKEINILGMKVHLEGELYIAGSMPEGGCCVLIFFPFSSGMRVAPVNDVDQYLHQALNILPNNVIKWSDAHWVSDEYSAWQSIVATGDFFQPA